MTEGDFWGIVNQVYHSIPERKRTEDLKQGLYLSILETVNNHPEHKDNRAYLYRCCQNSLYNHLNKEKRYTETFELGVDLDNVGGVAANRYYRPDQYYFASELQDQLFKWAIKEKVKTINKIRIIMQFLFELSLIWREMGSVKREDPSL